MRFRSTNQTIFVAARERTVWRMMVPSSWNEADQPAILRRMAVLRSFPVNCPSCEVIVSAEVVKSYEVRDEFGSERTVHFMLRCPQCSGPFLCREYGLNVGADIGWTSEDFIVLYPAALTLDASVPKLIADSFNEGERCYGARSFTACAIMCRRTLEGICAHHNVQGSNLARKLERLKNDGVIEQRLFEWADSLRMVGNEAAHDVTSTVSKEDARDLLDFTRALVEYIFTFTESFRKFQERRAKRHESRALDGGAPIATTADG